MGAACTRQCRQSPGLAAAEVVVLLRGRPLDILPPTVRSRRPCSAAEPRQAVESSVVLSRTTRLVAQLDPPFQPSVLTALEQDAAPRGAPPSSVSG